ncbi:MAG: SDR family NAD(P)-dependent oxidoreductase [Candidatus Kariarchaeaceae archaeon]|jgi:NAD(P)-dependent dehydrogenase (short-subunit alcohol dehydrogenase family)
MELNNATALVTGGAHRVGKGIATSLARKGTNLVLHYGRSEDAAVKTRVELQDMGVEVELVQIDLTDSVAIREKISGVLDSFDLQLVVNSAATFVKRGFAETTPGDLDLSLDVNLKAPFLINQLSLATLQQHEDALIVNIGDLSGLDPWKGYSAHGLSKAGLIHLTKVLAREIAPIRVNAIVPGPILPPPHMEETDPIWNEMIDNIPLKRSGSPSDIGNAVVYLAESDYVTGTVMRVDGGEGLVGPKNH